jgi:hypothetical protein
MFGLTVHVRPVDGLTDGLKFTVALKPFKEVTVIVDVPVVLASIDTVVGLAVTVKSGGWVTVTVAEPVLVEWAVSPLYMAETVMVPTVDPMTVTLQLPDASVHVPPGVKVTVPVGVSGVPAADVSATVAVQVELWPTLIVDGVQLTVVLLVRRLTVTFADPELVVWFASPP